jgi:Domain of unknown function (DUF222)
MPVMTPEPGPDDEQPVGGAPSQDAAPPTLGELNASPERETPQRWGGPGWAWVEGSADTGPVPEVDRPGVQPDGLTGGGLPTVLDYQALLDGLAAAELVNTNPEDQDAEFDEWLAADREGRLEPTDSAQIAALAVEHMDPGAAQGGWLEVAVAGAGRLDENALNGLAIAARKQASRAAAIELTAVGQLAARTAAADEKIGLMDDGRPARVSRDAVGQIELALKLSHYGAEARADLAVTLTWRLSATGAALAAGRIDAYRAQLIADATGMLNEELARRVEEQVLPGAGELTTSRLRQKLGYAVIAADPEGAEQRRKDAERNAELRLYADDDQTATLMLTKQPQIEAAASFARVSALAQARIAAGMPGTLNFHRSQVALGLLLGTLPPIPPAEDAPPDQPPPDDGPGTGGPGPAADGSDSGPADDPLEDLPAPRDEDAPPDDGFDDHGPDGGQGDGRDPADEDDGPLGTWPVPAWPALGAIPPAFARRDPARPADGRRAGGLLDMLLPWTSLAGLAERPGTLGRIGPITAVQARVLAQAAEHDPGAQWRVIVTNSAGQAMTVTRIRRRARRGPGGARDGPPPGPGLVGRVTVTVTEDTVTEDTVSAGCGPGGAHRRRRPGRPEPASQIAAAALRAAAKALAAARSRAAADQAAGGCAHTDESPAYRPPPRLREHVIARDVTCRNPSCGQPAWRGDLDHTIPWDDGGRTCRCDLGGACRRDHQLKQHSRWKLEQTRPGFFTWTTPAGRTYTVGPDTHPV